MWVKAIWVTTLLGSLCKPTNSISLESVRLQNFSESPTHPSPIYTNPQRILKTEYDTKTLAREQLQTVRDIIAADFERLERSRQKGWSHDKKVKKEKSIQVTVEDSGFPTLEELRAKCQHLARLYEHLGAYSSDPSTEEKHENVEVLNVTSPKPDVNRTFIPRVPDMTTRQPATKQPYPRVAISAVQSSTHRAAPSTTTTTTTTEATTTEKMKIRYTKFEPVILQKTILTDGRVVYNWYRSLPTAAVDFSGLPSMSPPPQFAYDLMAEEISERAPSDVQTTTTTTERSSWFDPFGLFGGGGGAAAVHEKEELTTTESSTVQPSTTTTPTFTPKIKTSAPITTTPEPLVKIIVPVRYGPIDASHAPHNEPITPYRTPPQPDLKPPPPQPEGIPRFTLGYTGAGYGLGIPYANAYNPDYMNYMRDVQ